MAAPSPRTRFASPLLYLIPLAILASPDPARADGGPFLVRLERGDSMQVLRVEPATFGMLRYVRADSVEGYLSGHWVQSITDASGRDVASDVLERRRAVGVDPLLYRIGDGSLRRRHAPRREDRTFGIFETGYYQQVSGPTSYGDDEVMMTTQVGAMRNLSRSLAVGGVLHLQIDDDRFGFGVGARGRRWLSNAFSVDGGAGWLFAGDDDRGEFKTGAFFGEAAINFSDHLQLAARIESWRFARRDYLYFYGDSTVSGYLVPRSQPYDDVVKYPARRETRVHIGAKAGRYPGVLLVVIVSLVALGVQSTKFNY